jgi:hypothetical protein
VLTAVPAPQLKGADAVAEVLSAMPSAIAEPAMKSFIRMILSPFLRAWRGVRWALALRWRYR